MRRPEPPAETQVVPDTLPDDVLVPRRRRRMLRLSTLPTALTVGNLVCGFVAIVYMTDAHALFGTEAVERASSRLVAAGWVILLGMVFDALDGRVARLTRSTSHFGGALDSLADLVTFGVAPALVAMVLIQDAFGSAHARLALLTACFYVICAALRLARYNAEQEEPDTPVTDFVGLPSPGAAGVIASLAICHQGFFEWWELAAVGKWFAAHVVGFGVLAFLALLMVSRVPYAHLGNRFLRGARPVGRVGLVLFVLMLLLYLEPQTALAAGLALYALSGPVSVIPRLIRGRRNVVPDLFD